MSRAAARAALVACLATLLPAAVGAQASRTGAAPDAASAAARDAARDTTRGFSTPSAIARDARAFARAIGLWGSLGLGRGNAGLSCPSCAGEHPGAYALQAAVGGRLHPRLHVGVETWAWLDVFGGGEDRIARGTQLLLRHYPRARSGLFVGGGVGVSRYALDGGDGGFAAAAPTLSFGAGWDVAWRGVTLAPALTAFVSTGGALESVRTGNAIADNARLTMLRTSVAVTWY